MARTPKNTQGQDFIVLSTDEIRGEDPTAGAGLDLNMRGGAAAVASAAAGGDVLVTGGGGDGAGVGGNVTLSPGAGGTPGGVIIHYATWPAADAAGVLTSNGAGVLSWGSGSVETLQTAYVAGNTIVTSGPEGSFDVSGTEAISLDASAASNFTVAGAVLTLATTTSGNIRISSADGTTAGAILVETGDGTGVGNDGADFLLTTGDGSAGTATAGGDAGGVTGQTGAGGTGDGALAGGAGGDYQWATGAGGLGGATGSGGAAGGFVWTGAVGGNAGGANGGGGVGSGFSFTTGDGGNGLGIGAGGAAGTFTVTTGTSGTGASLTDGGDVTFTTGSGASTGGAFFANTGAATGAAGIGGEISLTAGNNAVVAASGKGGDVTITAGDTTDGGSTGDGGSIILNPGTASGSGTDGTVTVNGKLTVTGAIDPTAVAFTEQSSVPIGPVAGEGTVWVRDDAVQTLMFTDDAGDDFEVIGGGATRMQEIPLLVATVNMDPGPDATTNPSPAGGLPGVGASPGTRGENLNSRIQYLEFGKSTENSIGFNWNIVLPTTYSGNGLTVEFWVSSDSVGSASGAGSFAGTFERHDVPFDIDAVVSYAATQAATGTTISGTPWTTVMGTITFTNAQIDGLLAGESGRFALLRLQSDAYAGEVRFTTGRIYETP